MSQPAITVLFVDDELPILRSIKRSLADAPFVVMIAHGPAEALGILASCRVDVLVADIDMPDMTGLELVQIARRDHPATARMLLTGAATMERTIRAINEGEVQRFYEKPLEPVGFIEDIEAMSERLFALRRLDEEDRRQEYLRVLSDWLDTVFPGAGTIERNSDGEVMIDLLALVAGVDDFRLPSIARNLLRTDL